MEAIKQYNLYDILKINICDYLDPVSYIKLYKTCKDPIIQKRWLEKKAEYYEYNMEIAIAHKQMDVVEWLKNKNIGYDSNTAIVATKHGHLDLVKWLYEKKNKIHAHIYDIAASNGHLDILKWLYEQCAVIRKEVAIIEAIAGNHLDIIIWIHEKFKDILSNRWRGPPPANIAAHWGYIEILEWLYNRGQVCTPGGMDDAILNEHLDTAKWLKEHDNDIFYESTAIDYCAKYGYLDVIKSLYNNEEPCLNDIEKGSHIEMIEWLMKYGAKGSSEQSMSNAAMYGQLDVLIWLHGKGQVLSEYCINFAARNGHIDIVMWIYENDRTTYIMSLMIYASNGGQLDIMKTIYEKGIENPCSRSCVYIAVKKGYLDMLKWIFEIIKRDKDDDVLKYLINLPISAQIPISRIPYEKRLSKFKKNLLQIASRNGHLHVYKWLKEF